MEIYHFNDGKFETLDFDSFFEHAWEDGKDQSEFLEKNGFSYYGDKICGLTVHTHVEKSLFFVQCEFSSICYHFITEGFPNLIKLFSFFGINFSKESCEKWERVIDQWELEEDFATQGWEIISVIPLADTKVFVTARNRITTRAEREQEYHKMRREKAKQKELEKS